MGIFGASNNFFFDIAMGKFDGIKALVKLGRNIDVDKDTEEDLWAGGGKWVEPQAPRIHHIASLDNRDGAGDRSGAQSIHIFGLDKDYKEIDEVLALNGTTPVPTKHEYNMIYLMLIETAGYFQRNYGAVAAIADVDGTVTARINPSQGQTQLGMYIVPAGKTAYITKLQGTAYCKKDAHVSFALFVKPFGGAFNLKHQFNLQTDGSSSVDLDFDYPIVVNSKSLIKMSCISSENKTDVSGSFVMILKDD